MGLPDAHPAKKRALLCVFLSGVGTDDNDNDDNILELPTLDEDENEWDGHSVEI